MATGRLSPEQKAEPVILGIGNTGEVSKLCRQSLEMVQRYTRCISFNDSLKFYSAPLS